MMPFESDKKSSDKLQFFKEQKYIAIFIGLFLKTVFCPITLNLITNIKLT